MKKDPKIGIGTVVTWYDGEQAVVTAVCGDKVQYNSGGWDLVDVLISEYRLKYGCVAKIEDGELS